MTSSGLEHGREPDGVPEHGVLDAPDGELAGRGGADDGGRRRAVGPVRVVASVDATSLCDSGSRSCWMRRSSTLPMAPRGSAGWRTGTEASRTALRESVLRVLPPVLRWFGPDSERSVMLKSAGVVSGAGAALRDRLLNRLAPLLDLVDVERPEEGCPRRFRRGAAAGGRRWPECRHDPPRPRGPQPRFPHGELRSWRRRSTGCRRTRRVPSARGAKPSCTRRLGPRFPSPPTGAAGAGLPSSG